MTYVPVWSLAGVVVGLVAPLDRCDCLSIGMTFDGDRATGQINLDARHPWQGQDFSADGVDAVSARHSNDSHLNAHVPTFLSLAQ